RRLLLGLAWALRTRGYRAELAGIGWELGGPYIFHRQPVAHVRVLVNGSSVSVSVTRGAGRQTRTWRARNDRGRDAEPGGGRGGPGAERLDGGGHLLDAEGGGYAQRRDVTNEVARIGFRDRGGSRQQAKPDEPGQQRGPAPAAPGNDHAAQAEKHYQAQQR